MQRARRLASVVVVASLGVAGLSACRSEPSVAAYIGDSMRISQDRVDAVYNDVRDKLRAAPAGPDAPAPGSSGPATVPIDRADIVSLLVGSQIIDKLAADQSVPAPTETQLQEADIANGLRLPADSEYAQLYAKWVYNTGVLESKVTTPGTPTEADLHLLHDGLVEGQQYDPSQQFETFKKDLAGGPGMATLQKAAGVRDEITKALSAADVRINPRFEPKPLPLILIGNPQTGAVIVLMTVSVGDDDAVAPVTDAR